jgi:hypothetical protein
MAPPRQWNPPTSRVLAPGETVSFALRFVLDSDAAAAATMKTAAPAATAAGGAAEAEAGAAATNTRATEVEKGTALVDTILSPTEGDATAAPKKLPGKQLSKKGGTDELAPLAPLGPLATLGPRGRDTTLCAAGQPTVHAVPGYVIPADLDGASLWAGASNRPHSSTSQPDFSRFVTDIPQSCNVSPQNCTRQAEKWTIVHGLPLVRFTAQPEPLLTPKLINHQTHLSQDVYVEPNNGGM